MNTRIPGILACMALASPAAWAARYFPTNGLIALLQRTHPGRRATDQEAGA